MPDTPPETEPSKVAGAIGHPFDEQIAFFRRKLGRLVPTQRWDDMLGQAHDDGFMVAGAMEADLLTDLAAAVDKAIAEGRGIEEFRRDFRAIVAKHGWTGWTGEGTVKGEAWRVKTILKTNAYTSYAAGRFAQLKADGFPLWVYRHGDSREPRPEHLDLNGLVLPPDHPFWAKYYPPSDWGCSCYVLGARNENMARRLGGDVGKTLPSWWNKRDPRTGEPAGIGKGWGYAPGASVAPIVSAMAAKIGSWDFRVAKAFMDAVPAERADALARAYRQLPSTADDARRFAQRVTGDLPDPAPGRTLGMIESRQAQAIADKGGPDLQRFDFSLSPDEVRHVISGHGDNQVEIAAGNLRAVTTDDFAKLPRIIASSSPTLAGTSKVHKAQVVELSAVIDGERFVTRWEVRGRRRTLALLTMFIKKAR